MTTNSPLIRRAALGAAIVYTAGIFYIGRECRFLWRYWRLIIHEHGLHFVVFSLLIMGNLVCALYLIWRFLSLRETGRKLAHFEKQLLTGDSVAEELATRLRERHEPLN